MRPFAQPTRWAGGVVVLLLALLLGLTGPTLAQVPVGQAVVILDVRGVIDPVVAPYVKPGLDTANSTDASLVIILPDTPGGLDTAMRAMVQVILNSDIPLIVFVEPLVAQAASVGVSMTMAAYMAAIWLWRQSTALSAPLTTNDEPARPGEAEVPRPVTDHQVYPAAGVRQPVVSVPQSHRPCLEQR